MSNFWYFKYFQCHCVLLTDYLLDLQMVQQTQQIENNKNNEAWVEIESLILT